MSRTDFLEFVVNVEGSATTTSWMLKASFFSDVINFHLEQVITPSEPVFQ
jgi:hypothetical protein